MNAQDYHGNTPLLKCAMQDSRDTVRRLLSSKAAIERHLLDLSVQNMYGRNVLHYLVINRDRHNIKLFLNILEDSKDALNAVDCYNMSPLMYCLTKNYMEEAATILNHPKTQTKLKLENADAQGKTLLHLAAEKGNFTFWTMLTGLKSCNLCIRDDEGNTPLMTAAKAKQNGMIRSWLGKQTNKTTDVRMMAAQNSEGHNLFMLVLIHLEGEVVQKFITTLDLGSCIDQRDKKGSNALLIAAASEQWNVLRSILCNNKLEDLAIDIHAKNSEEYTTLVIVLSTYVKLIRQIQNYKMKFDKANEKKTESQAEDIWSLVQLLLEKERDYHGTSPTSGKEAGIESLKKQMEAHSQIKSPLTEDVITEFSKLYMVKIKAKKKPEPVPEIPKEEPKKVLAVSSFQEQMNAIYQQSVESEKKRNDQRDKDANKPRANGVSSSKQKEEKSEPKTVDHAHSTDVTNKKSVEDKLPVKSKPKPPAKINESMKSSSTPENSLPKKAETKDSQENENENEPSIEEIRAMWKKNRKSDRKEIKEDNFDLNSVMEDIMKKAEEKVHKSKTSDEDNPYLSETMNEEIQWALEQKKQHQEENVKNGIEVKQNVVEENGRNNLEVKQKVVENVTETEKSENDKILNLVDIMEKKAEAKRAAKVKKEETVTKLENQKREELELQELDDAMSEEIRWAYEQKAAMMEERKKQEEEELLRKQKEEQDNLMMSSIAEKYRAKEAAKAKEKEDLLRRQNEEKEKIEKLQKEAEDKMKKIKQTSPEQNKMDDELSKLPRWKREKILRERESRKLNKEDGKEKDVTDTLVYSENVDKAKIIDNQNYENNSKLILNNAHIAKEPSPPVRKIEESRINVPVNGVTTTKSNTKSPKQEDQYLAERLNEEIMWAEELKKQAEEHEENELQRKEEYDADLERKRLEQKSREDKQMIDLLERKAKEKLMKEKETNVIVAKEKEEVISKEGNEITSECFKNFEKKSEEFTNWLQVEIKEVTKEEKDNEDTPPAPVRRRRAAVNEEQDSISPPIIPNRKSRVEKEKSPISLTDHGTGVRSFGVSVDVRPGYKHASTQTDPVQTCDIAI